MKERGEREREREKERERKRERERGRERNYNLEGGRWRCVIRRWLLPRKSLENTCFLGPRLTTGVEGFGERGASSERLFFSFTSFEEILEGNDFYFIFLVSFLFLFLLLLSD